MVITTEADKTLAGLVKELDKVVGANKDKGMVGFVVVLSDDLKGTSEKLKTYATENGIQNVALTVNKEGKKTPGNLKLNPDAKHTVILYKEKKVAFAKDYKGEVAEKDVKEVAAAAEQMVGGKAETPPDKGGKK